MNKPLYSVDDAVNDIRVYKMVESRVGSGLARPFKVMQGTFETIGNYGDYRHYFYKSTISNPNMTTQQKLEYLYLNRIIK